MPLLNPTTELEAVNSMLLSIGQAPVSTLNVTGIQDVNTAKMMLTTVTRAVLSCKYNWNTDEGYSLTRDIDGVILIPNGILEADPQDPSVNAVIRRHPEKGLALWDKDGLTWAFTSSVPCKVTWGFSFEDLPEIARMYIMIAAGRKFQRTIVGSKVLDSFEEVDETKAWIELQKTELRSRDNNLFRKNPRMASLMSRSY